MVFVQVTVDSDVVQLIAVSPIFAVNSAFFGKFDGFVNTNSMSVLTSVPVRSILRFPVAVEPGAILPGTTSVCAFVAVIGIVVVPDITLLLPFLRTALHFATWVVAETPVNCVV